jgi:hypothetical protein
MGPLPCRDTVPYDERPAVQRWMRQATRTETDLWRIILEDGSITLPSARARSMFD